MGVVLLFVFLVVLINPTNSCQNILNCGDCVNAPNCEFIILKSYQSYCVSTENKLDNVKLSFDNQKACKSAEKILSRKFVVTCCKQYPQLDLLNKMYATFIIYRVAVTQ